MFFLGAEYFLADTSIDPATLPMTYWLCFLFAIMFLGLVLTFVKGLDGQSIFYVEQIYSGILNPYIRGINRTKEAQNSDFENYKIPRNPTTV